MQENNAQYGFTKDATLGKGNIDTYGVVTKAVGSPPTVDEFGAKIPTSGTPGAPSAAQRTSAEYAFKSTRPGEKEKTPAQIAAMARLMK